MATKARIMFIKAISKAPKQILPKLVVRARLALPHAGLLTESPKKYTEAKIPEIVTWQTYDMTCDVQ